MAFSGFQKTRLGLAAFARGLYGSFAGKTEATTELGPGFGINTSMTNNGRGVLSTISTNGLGKNGPIVLGFGINKTMSNSGLGVSGPINNNGIGKNGEI